MSGSIKEFCKAWWSEVYNRIIGAAVFLDDASAECLHWDGGLFNLINGGAVAVKSLSPFEYAKKEHKKAVFITQANPTQLRNIYEIIHNSDFTHCILISCVSLDVVYLELNEGSDVSDVIAAGRAPAEATKQLEEMLIEWIGKKQCAAEVVHIPIFSISLTNDIFLSPPYQEVYPLFDGKLIPETPSADLYTVNNSERSQVRRLASGLNSLFDSLNLKEEVFFMGTFSSLVAGVLENSPVCCTRRKNCSKPASLILVDRTLDVCGVTSHSAESVIDTIMTALPRLPGHSTDVAVDMSLLCEANVNTHPDDIQIGPGCLYHAGDDSCAQTFEHMMNKSQKEVMFDLYNKLSKLDVQKSPGPKTLLKVTPQSIEKIVTAAKGNYEVIEKHLGVLEQSLAMVQTLKSPKRVQAELIASLEKQVLQNLATSRNSTSVLHQVTHLIKNHKECNLSLESLLALLVHVYSLIGTDVSFSNQHEESLEDILSVALFESRDTLFKEEGVETQSDCSKVSARIMSRLKDISQMRKSLQNFKSVLCEGGSVADAAGGTGYRGVMQQLSAALVARETPPDLQRRADTISHLLRTGLNMLTNKKVRNSKHPFDNPTVIIFVIGGITGDECRQLHRSVMTSGIDNNVIIGSTKLVTPGEAMRDALAL